MTSGRARTEEGEPHVFARVTESDSAPVVPGMVSVRLDTLGRLIQFSRAAAG